MKTYFKASLLALLIACVGVAFAGRDGSGNYTLPAGNPVNTGTAISSTWANNTLADIATALTNSLAKDGQTTPTANLPMGAFRHTNVANATARNNYAAAGQVQDFSMQTLGSVAGTNTITGNLNPAITAYSAGMLITFQPANSSTGAVTLAVNGLTALDVQKQDGDALVSGDLVVGIPAVLVLDTGADDWILLNPQSANLSNGIAISDLARLSQTNTFAVRQNISGSGIAEKLRLIAADSVGDDYISFYDVDGTTRIGYVGFAEAAGDGLYITNDVSGASINLQTAGGGAVQVNGAQVPVFAWFFQSNGGAGCTVAAGGRNVSGCNRSSAGTYTVTLTGFTATPVCTATEPSSGNQGHIGLTVTSTTNINVTRTNSANTLTDTSFNLQCVGT